jgi:hypothetical protein
MGHLLIGTPPETLSWRKVIHLIGSGADVAAIAAATSQAAEESLIAAGRDLSLGMCSFYSPRSPLLHEPRAFRRACASSGCS